MGDKRASDKRGRVPTVIGDNEPLATHDHPVEVRTIITCAIDDVALAALRERHNELTRCALCEEIIEGDAYSTGLMMWTRGDDIRYDEPPLCGACSSSITVSAWSRWING